MKTQIVEFVNTYNLVTWTAIVLAIYGLFMTRLWWRSFTNDKFKAFILRKDVSLSSVKISDLPEGDWNRMALIRMSGCDSYLRKAAFREMNRRQPRTVVNTKTGTLSEDNNLAVYVSENHIRSMKKRLADQNKRTKFLTEAYDKLMPEPAA